MVDIIVKNQRQNKKKKMEKEKMLGGEYFDPNDKVLLEEKKYAKELLSIYNQTEEWEDGERYRILKRLFGKSGELITIEPSFRCDYGKNIYIDEEFYAYYIALPIVYSLKNWY